MTHTTYHIVQGENAHHLMMTVNKHIRSGWEPLGGVAVEIRMASDGGEYCVLHQALIRHSTRSAYDEIAQIDNRLAAVEAWRGTMEGDGK